ncbi:hypothetical protein PMAYCL1PPCAC_11420, partial [Pristionchus mayeri]
RAARARLAAAAAAAAAEGIGCGQARTADQPDCCTARAVAAAAGTAAPRSLGTAAAAAVAADYTVVAAPVDIAVAAAAAAAQSEVLQVEVRSDGPPPVCPRAVSYPALACIFVLRATPPSLSRGTRCAVAAPSTRDPRRQTPPPRFGTVRRDRGLRCDRGEKTPPRPRTTS